MAIAGRAVALSVVALLMTLLLHPSAVHAQTTPLPLRQLLPLMPMVICPNIEKAEGQAARSRQNAQRVVNAGQYKETVKKPCQFVQSVAILEEEVHSIPPFTAWAPEINPLGEYDFTVEYDGFRQELTFGLALQRVRYYRGNIADRANRSYEAWIELPDSPFVLRYLRERGKW